MGPEFMEGKLVLNYFDCRYPVVLYNDTVIYSVKIQHILVINTINYKHRPTEF